MTIVIGLTGNIGTGKNTVLQMLAELGTELQCQSGGLPWHTSKLTSTDS